MIFPNGQMSHNSNKIINKESWEKIYPPAKLVNNPYHETVVQIRERTKNSADPSQMQNDINTLLNVIENLVKMRFNPKDK